MLTIAFYCQPEVCVYVNGKQSKPFHVGVAGSQQGCILSPVVSIAVGDQMILEMQDFGYAQI